MAYSFAKEFLPKPPDQTGWYWVAEYGKPAIIAWWGYVGQHHCYGWRVCGYFYYRTASPISEPATPEVAGRLV